MLSTKKQKLIHGHQFKFKKNKFDSLIQDIKIITYFPDNNSDDSFFDAFFQFKQNSDIQIDFGIIDIKLIEYRVLIVFCFYPLIFIFDKTIPNFFWDKIKNIFNPKSIICSSALTMNEIKNIPQTSDFNLILCDLHFNLFENSYYFRIEQGVADLYKKIQNVFMIFVIELGKLNTETDRNRRNFDNPFEKVLPKKFNQDDFIFVQTLNFGRNFSRIGYCVEDDKLYFVKTYRDIVNYQREKELYETISIQNPYLLRYYGTIEDNITNIVIEYINSESLDHYTNLDLESRFSIFLSVLISIQALHLNGFVYRDLKPENILIDRNSYVILIDFDLSRNIGNTDLAYDENALTHCVGNMVFQAPDLNNRFYSYPVDIYSLGLLMYYIFTDEIPPRGSLSLSFQYFLFNDLFHNALNVNPSERYEISGLIKTFCMIVIDNYNSHISLQTFKRTLRDFIRIQFHYFKLFKKLKKSYQRHLILTKSDFFASIPELILYCSDRNLFELDKESTFLLHNLISLSDYEKHSKYLHFRTQLVHTDNPHQQYQLAMYYYRPQLRKHYVKQWYSYLKLAARNHISEALYCLATNYETGYFLPKNTKKAIRYYLRAASLNHILSQTILALFFDLGIYVPSDPQKLLFYFSLAAQQQQPLAQLYIAVKILEGKLFDGNPEKALYYFEQAIKSEEPVPLFIYGRLHQIGNIVPYDINKTIYYWEKSKHPVAYFGLGDLYYKGKQVRKDVNKAFEYYKKSADLNHCEGQLKTGVLYYLGRGCEQNLHKAVYYLTLSALQKNKYAQMSLGILYCSIDSPFPDHRKALIYLTNAASQNLPPAQYYLGMLYYQGTVVKYNLQTAIFYFKLAIKNLYQPAYLQLANIYETSELMDLSKAIYYYQQGSQLQNAVCQYCLARLYKSGKLGFPDYQKAIYYYKLSADNQFPLAMIELSILYYEGKFVKQNLFEAKRYSELAATHNIPQAFYNLGQLHSNYPFLELKKSLEYFHKAAEMNEPHSQYLLSDKYINGIDVIQNVPLGFGFLVRSANNGFPYALLDLGRMYYEGYFVTANFAKAFLLFKKAALQNNIESFYALGSIFYEGQYVTRDITKAIKYFTLASNATEACSKVNLGVIYLNGDGVPKNIYTAVNYFQDSIKDNDHPLGLFNLARIYFFGLGNIAINILLAIQYLEIASKRSHTESQLFLYLIYSMGEFSNPDRLSTLSAAIKKNWPLTKQLLITIGIKRSRALTFIKYYDYPNTIKFTYKEDFQKYVFANKDIPLPFNERTSKSVLHPVNEWFYKGMD